MVDQWPRAKSGETPREYRRRLPPPLRARVLAEAYRRRTERLIADFYRTYPNLAAALAAFPTEEEA